MKDGAILDQVKQAVIDLEGEKLNALCAEALDEKIDAWRIVRTITDGMQVVGEKYEKNEYFLPELIMAGSVTKSAMEILWPHLKVSGGPGHGKVVIGTVEGDLHDIGKNIVGAMLTSAGFAVVDLGVDVAASRFVQAVRKEKPDILAMSALLLTTMEGMRRVLEALKEAGLRQSVKVLIGGRPTSAQFAEEIGADAYGESAVQAVKIAKDLISSH